MMITITTMTAVRARHPATTIVAGVVKDHEVHEDFRVQLDQLDQLGQRALLDLV